jgi:hypothetical protein
MPVLRSFEPVPREDRPRAAQCGQHKNLTAKHSEGMRRNSFFEESYIYVAQTSTMLNEVTLLDCHTCALQPRVRELP